MLQYNVYILASTTYGTLYTFARTTNQEVESGLED